MFLYHCVSDPFTGRRYSFSPSSTNQTGTEIVFPDFLPIKNLRTQNLEAAPTRPPKPIQYMPPQGMSLRQSRMVEIVAWVVRHSELLQCSLAL
jgi:hypothetical protein